MAEEQHAGSGDPVQNMHVLITEIARALVDVPDAVSVESFEDGATVVLRLNVAPEDIGKLIGKQGRTARSLRTILGAASMKFKRRFALDIVEGDSKQGDDNDDDPGKEG